MNVTLDLTQDEFIALIALIGAGMNTYLGDIDNGAKHLRALDRIPQAVIDGLVAKINAPTRELAERLAAPGIDP